jgi:hypothetical protein
MITIVDSNTLIVDANKLLTCANTLWGSIKEYANENICFNLLSY